MKLLIECSSKECLYSDKVDGIILPLETYSVESKCFFSLEEIKNIIQSVSCGVFIKVNKNFMNEEIDDLKKVLQDLDQWGVDGVFFYDLAVLELKNEMNLKLPLIWNQTHMVNNYKTCDYYYSKGVSYALVGKEITLEEIKEIVQNSRISLMVEVVSRPSVAFSKRKLLTHYYQDLGKEKKNDLIIHERGTNQNYELFENQDGTSFFLDIVTNGTSVIKELYDINTPFIIMREYGLEELFSQLIIDTKNYIQTGCKDTSYIEKYKKIGDSTNFFFRKTIYKVKKNG